VLYPAGYQGDRVMLTPSVKLPAGWSFATALQKAADTKDGTQFAPVTLTDLVDSPLSAGQHYRRIDLAPGATPSVHLNLFADREENLAMTDLQIKHHRELVKQAVKFFGAQHYDRYNFLLVLSDRTAHFGLEHHESSDNRSSADFFTSPTAYFAHPTLLPHEYTHSWNGKFRRPAGLATGNFFSPMKGELLWVYEGMTNYMGEVFAARSGMWTPEQYRDALAITAAQMDHTPGRGWRPLQDTADQAQVLYNAPGAWANYRRLVDFYPEGSLVWLDVDTKIRELTGNKRSLDDYAQIFYGKDPAFSKTSHDVKPYTFEDVVKALNTTVAFDWATFLKTRLTSTNERAPLDGITRGGWKLVYTSTPTEVYKAVQKENKTLDLFPSLGFIVAAAPGHGSEPGMVADVLWNSPAFEAGLVPGMKIVAVDGEAFDPDLLELAIQRTAKAKATIELLVQIQDYFSTVRITYAGGPKYPRLERIADKPDLLTPVVTTK
jgi:predicted metalloprotease with PDZ domain